MKPGRFAAQVGISRSMLYYVHKQSGKDWHTKCLIEEVLREFPSYGHKRLALSLCINKKRVLRVMKIYGIKPYRRRGTKPKKVESVLKIQYPNLLLLQVPLRPGQIWAADFTYLKYEGKFLYVATVLDLYSIQHSAWHLNSLHDYRQALVCKELGISV